MLLLRASALKPTRLKDERPCRAMNLLIQVVIGLVEVVVVGTA
ncbi:MAG TPA: hypothetical protein VF023_01055 [Bryobacteraceae bacterium]|jgi:hypothetical protein